VSTESAVSQWGEEIAVEQIGRVPYRMYTQRPRRLGDLLVFMTPWRRRPYLIFEDRVLAYEHIRELIAAKAACLYELGLRRGERAVLLGWNSPEWIVNFWACLELGAVPVLANAWWSATEIADAMTLIGPRLVLADRSAASRLAVGIPCGPWEMPVLPPARDVADVTVDRSRDEEETALIIFTSGTSGKPKAVVLSHRAVLARLQMTLHVTRKLPHQIDRGAHDVSLLTGPLFHVGTMHAILRGVVVGDTLVLSKGRYDPAEVLALIERHKVKRWSAVPTMVSRLLDHPDLARRDIASLKSISVGGAPVHAELMRRMRTELPSVSPRIPTGYGLTENGGQATAAAGSEDLSRLGSTGRPMPCVELAFRTHPGLPDGEILLRSPTQMSGYFGLTESPIDADGWLHTGDLGRLDEKGNLWITGRCKDMIIRGGENIAPAAVERELLMIEGVKEAAVFGVAHADLGEEVMAVVVSEGGLSAQEMRRQLAGKLASFAVPTRWHLQSEPLPTNQTGKIDKAALHAALRQQWEQPTSVEAS
jgi:acyl-CoA synthetase (AMP-forming)/AMP-acid ligase II